jgi:hypothetical protein
VPFYISVFADVFDRRLVSFKSVRFFEADEVEVVTIF